MEVHHHPELPHGKKKHFKEYALEFLMIFLAVTMGFIAESLREHISDNSKEKEYIKGFIKDLKSDTTQLNFSINGNQNQLKGLDSLKNISKNKLAEFKIQDSLYLFHNRYLHGFSAFLNDDVTLIQLRNTGNYRLIRNDGVLDSIAFYQKNMDGLDLQFGFLSRSLEQILNMSNSIFDLTSYDKFQLHPSSTSILLTNNKIEIYEFYNRSYLFSQSLTSYNRMLKHQLEYSARLIAYLKKSYGVEQ
jgi:hypothetical protein